MSKPHPQHTAGALAAAGAYFCWGLWPIFWKQLDGIDAGELIAHRIVWSEVTIVVLLVAAGRFAFWRGVPHSQVRSLGFSATLIAINWWVYIWAVGAGKIVESSLGYFINPLVSVLFGVVFLHERLNRAQWSAVAIAGMGVLYLTVQTGTPPWIALALAFTFGGYGLIRKTTPIDSQRGLAIEGAWLFVPALAYLAWLAVHGYNHLGTSVKVNALLLSTGPVSALPLLLFAFGAQRIPLSLVGILQYIGPTLQLLTGVFLYGEPFTHTQLIGFGLIWSALALYATDGLIRYATARAAAQ